MKVGYGHYYRPDVKEFHLNKYAMPANDQLNIDFYYFLGKHLQLEYLLTRKGLLGNSYENPNFEINKVNMWHHNIIMNYKF